MCVPHADWDLEISEELKDKFDFMVKFVKTLAAVKVYFYEIMPRDYIVSCELHRFLDASEKAMLMCDKKQFHFDFASCFKVKSGHT